MIGIIILNWNGWKDTIECLNSLYNITDEEFFIVLIDNNSCDNSIQKLKKYFSEKSDIPFFTTTSENDNSLPTTIKSKTCILYCVKENLGFSKGNNRGLELAKRFHPEYYLLLNNDTVVEDNFLSELVNFINRNPKFSILTPRISYYSNKDIIWNCGGALWWGFRKYYYANQHISAIKEHEYIKIDYITGCALFFKGEIIKNRPLLTEKFFHGEEDFEFSYRMRSEGKNIACVLSSHIYHKVGLATKSLNSLGKTYAHYLNRFIDMRQQMNPVLYFFWKICYYPYLFLLLKRHHINFSTSFKYLKQLNKDSKKMESVSRDQFFKLLNGSIFETNEPDKVK